jgi:hypothetical protein
MSSGEAEGHLRFALGSVKSSRSRVGDRRIDRRLLQPRRRHSGLGYLSPAQQYPNSNGKDQEINANALPILIQETLKAQSAKIDMVSGPTCTSTGYLTSLQSALDRRGCDASADGRPGFPIRACHHPLRRARDGVPISLALRGRHTGDGEAWWSRPH